MQIQTVEKNILKIKAPYPKVEKAIYVAVNIGETTLKSHQVSDSPASESIMAVLSKSVQPLSFPPFTQHPWEIGRASCRERV